MSKTRIFALILIAIILAAILTNPPKEQFQVALKTKATELLKKQLEYKQEDAVTLGMTLFGDRIVQDFVSNNIIVENYYLFSLVRIRWEGQEIPIGGGAFRQIWLSPKLDEKADEIIGILKKL